MGEASGEVVVSVCMATHDGARFLPDQVHSILDQLGPCDELVIIDDASSDATRDYLSTLVDPRVRVVLNKVNRGYVRTFEEALGLARGRFLLLSDQDDIWTPNHVRLLVEALRENWVAATNLATLGGPVGIRGPLWQSDWTLRAKDSSRHVRNIIGILAGNRPYYGCAMGIRSDAVTAGALPMPMFLNESHDLWIALFGNINGSMRHIEARTVLRRLHENNQTPARPRGPAKVIASRLRLLACIAIILARRLRRSPVQTPSESARRQVGHQ